MILKIVFAATVCSVLLALSGPSRADEYRPGEYFGLDLSSALLSPKPLGPPAEFAPVRLQAMTDRGSEAARASAEPKAPPGIATPRTRIAHRGAGARAGFDPKARPKIATRMAKPAHRSAAASLAPKAAPTLASRKTRMAHAAGVRPRSAVRTLVARSRGNPLDAQAFDARAFDTRVQVWPCKSGGICNWKR
jgi:hypothetical protein